LVKNQTIQKLKPMNDKTPKRHIELVSLVDQLTESFKVLASNNRRYKKQIREIARLLNKGIRKARLKKRGAIYKQKHPIKRLKWKK